MMSKEKKSGDRLFSQFEEIKDNGSRNPKFFSEFIPKIQKNQNECEQYRDKIKAALTVFRPGFETDLILMTESFGSNVETIISQIFISDVEKFIFRQNNHLLYIFDETLYIYENYKIHVLSFNMEKQVFMQTSTLFLNDADRNPELLFFSKKNGGIVLLVLSQGEKGYNFSIYDISSDHIEILLRNLLILDEKIKKPLVFIQENGLFIVDFKEGKGEWFNLEEIIEKPVFFEVLESKKFKFHNENQDFVLEYKLEIDKRTYLQIKDQEKLWNFMIKEDKSEIFLIKSTIKSPKLTDKALIQTNVHHCKNKLFVLSQQNDTSVHYLKAYDL